LNLRRMRRIVCKSSAFVETKVLRIEYVLSSRIIKYQFSPITAQPYKRFVYPTITNDVLRVEAEGEPVDAVTVVNQVGQVIFTSQQVSSVGMSVLPAGMYLVQEQVVERVFKQ
jgi:hypothetical protein